MSEKNNTILIGSILAGVTLFFGVSFFAWTIVPQMQMGDYLEKTRTATNEHRLSVLLAEFNPHAFMFEPETYIEGYLRQIFLGEMFSQFNQGAFSSTAARTTVVTDGNNGTQTLATLLDIALQENIDYTKKHPGIYSYYFNIAKAYDAKFSLEAKQEYLLDAQTYYKLALATIADRQEVIFAYALNLLNQGKNQEAIDMLTSTVARNPEIPESHYELGQALAISGENNYAQSIDQFEFALSHHVNMVPTLTQQMYLKFFVYFYKTQDASHFRTAVDRLIEINPEQKDAYMTIVDYMQKNKSIPVINIEN